MTRDKFSIEVAARNGRPQRLVSVKFDDGAEFRDTIDTNSSVSRARLISRVGKKLGIESAELGWLDDRIVAQADAADEHADAAIQDDEVRKSTADLLVEIALGRYRIGRTSADEAFAVELDGPNVALMFRGSRDALRSSLSRAFREIHGRTPNSAALTDALTTLQGEAYVAEPETVHLRVAESDGAIIVDIGDSSGRAIMVGLGGWQVVDRSPVVFRRTAATGPLPVPERGGSLRELRAMLNVSATSWPLMVGWLVASLVPNMPHPILLLGGQQGTGKTTAARQLGGIIDPSPAPLRSQPRDVENWAVSAAASWLVSVDNISTISDWWSDSLCKAVTGDGWLRRKLYSDGDLAVLSFRRVILLTSIDAGALKGDLGDRVMLIDLEPIPETARQTERAIESRYQSAQPRILGALLDLLSRTMAELRSLEMARMPRMADFAQLLAAVDRATDNADGADNSALRLYLGQRERIATTVIESDPFALAIQSLMDDRTEWHGTVGELLELLTPERPPKSWPKMPQGAGGRIKRLIPAFEQAGIQICSSREGHSRSRQYHIERLPVEDGGATSASSASSATAEVAGFSVGELRTSADMCESPAGPGCPQQDGETLGNSWPADNADVADDYLPDSSFDPFDTLVESDPSAFGSDPDGPAIGTGIYD